MIENPRNSHHSLWAAPPHKNYRPQYACVIVATTVTYLIGRILETGDPVSLLDAHLAVGMAVLGNSGSGKSFFLQALLRQRMLQGKPFALWDPHGDLAKSLLAFAAGRNEHPDIKDDELWRKIHYVQLTPQNIIAYDPVARAPLRSVVGDYAYYQWLKTRVDRICKVMLRKVPEDQQDLMNRLKRWLKNVLFACLVAYDEQNSHVGLDKALIFTDPDAPQFGRYWDLVRHHVPWEVAQDFNKLIGTRRAIDREKWVESTINRLRDCMSPLTKLVYSQAKPSIDIKGIIDRGEFLLIDLKETNDFSSDEKVTIGGLLLMEVLSIKEAEEELPEDERKEYMVVVDEVGELLGDDLKRALGATRKWKCPIVLGAQDLSTFARGDFDMAAKVLTMCGTVVCFANTFKKDKEILADRIFCGNRDLFTQRMIEMQRQRGLQQLQVDEFSEGAGCTTNWSETDTTTITEGYAHSIGEALALANTFSDIRSQANGVSRPGVAPQLDKQVRNRVDNTGHASGGGKTHTTNNVQTSNKAEAKGKARMQGGGQTTNVGIVHKNLFMPNIVSEFEEDGTLKEGTPDLQAARYEQCIHTLGIGQAAIAIRGIQEAVVVQCEEVQEWWPNGATKYDAIRRMIRRLQELHPYYFRPSLRTSANVGAGMQEWVPLDADEPFVIAAKAEGEAPPGSCLGSVETAANDINCHGKNGKHTGKKARNAYGF